MQLNYFANRPRRPWAVRGLFGLLALAYSAQAQTYNVGTLYNTGSLYHGDRFLNPSTGSVVSTGATAVAYYAGSTFGNSAPYAGTAGATDQFIGFAGGAGLQYLLGSTAPSFYNLTLASGSTSPFVLGNPAGVNVANLLTLSNGITTGTRAVAGAIRLTNPGTQANTLPLTGMGTTRFIDGYLSKAGTNAFTYPLGAINPSTSTQNTTAAGAAIYSPITLSSPGGTTLNYTAGGTPNATSFATQTGGLQLATVSSREYYPMSVGTVLGATTITIPYGNFGPSSVGTPYVSNPAALTIAAYNGSTWTNLSSTPANTVDATNKTVTVMLPAALSNAYTALALATTFFNPLPVELTVFTAIKRAEDAWLSWTTASELNSASFEVQASTDGARWQVLGRVAAAGTSTTSRSYSYLDKNIARYGVSVVYYRLQQIDQDGTAAFSPVRTLGLGVLAWEVQAYPNPYETDLSAQLTTAEAGPVSLTMFDATGRVVLRREVGSLPGTHRISLDGAPAIATGTYVLLVQQNGHASAVHITRR